MPKRRARKPAKNGGKPVRRRAGTGSLPSWIPAGWVDVPRRSWVDGGAGQDVVAIFCAQLLAPALSSVGLSRALVVRCVDDVAARMTALLAVWRTPQLRDPPLVPVVEESTFYQPGDTPLAVRSFVAATVRNSRVEDLRFESSDIVQLTAAAVGFLAGVDLDACAPDYAAVPGAGAQYTQMSAAYPVAWASLGTLAELARTGQQYAEVAVTTPPEPFPVARLPRLRTSDEIEPTDDYVFKHFTSGMAPGLRPETIDCLTARPESYLMRATGYARVTRNLQVLVPLLEHLLTNAGAFVTPNHALVGANAVDDGSPFLVMRRRRLVNGARTSTGERRADRLSMTRIPTDGMLDLHRVLWRD